MAPLNKFLPKVSIALALTMAAPSVMAQDTSSAFRARLLDNAGQPGANIEVVIRDTRTGATRRGRTNADGLVTLPNLNIGGPYEVIVADADYRARTVTGIFLSLGETASADITLQPASATDEVVVQAEAISIAQLATGPSAVFSEEDLDTAAAYNRDLVDMIKSDPRLWVDEGFVNSVQCAGASPRFNSTTVDGVRMNDGFGLNSNGYPTQRMPFSYDSLQTIAVELAPFDVQYGGFSGCNINAVTKSGTNEFGGSFFFEMASDSLQGDELQGQSVNIASYSEDKMGFSFGGPIIKDKAFFYINYESFSGEDIFKRGHETSGAAEPVAGLTQANYNDIIRIARDVYGYDVGGTPASVPVDDTKYLIKLDYLLDDRHQIGLVYNYNDGFNISESDGDANEFEFDKHLYERGAEMTSYRASLKSQWSDKLSTEFNYSFFDLKNRQISKDGLVFGEMQIDVANANNDEATVYIGSDDSRHANSMAYDTTTLSAKAFYDSAYGQLLFGYEREASDIYNIFVQHNLTETRFDSIADFEAGIANVLYYGNAPSGNVADAAADWGYTVNTAFVQNTMVMDKLELVAGLRYEWYEMDDTPQLNSDFVDAYGYANTANLDGKSLLLPRLGVTYDMSDVLTLRGGIGQFGGGNPTVWISNNMTGDFLTQLQPSQRDFAADNTLFDIAWSNCRGGQTAPCPGYGTPTDLYNALVAGTGSPGFEMNVLDPNFDIPTEWKYAIGGTQLLGEYVLNFDLLISQSDDQAGIVASEAQASGTALGGLFPTYDDVASPDAWVLTNSGESKSLTLSASLGREYDNGLSWVVSYAHVDAEDTHSMTSSVAFSNYMNSAFNDPEARNLSRTNFSVENRYTFRVRYETEFMPNRKTKFSLSGNGNTGRPYSLTYKYDRGSSFGLNQIFRTSSKLMYIPTGANDPLVNFNFSDDAATNAAQTERFFDYLREVGAMAYAGQVLPRNSLEGSDFFKIDLYAEQELYKDDRYGQASAYFVMKNLTNFLNSDWGVLDEPGFPRMINVVDGDLSDDGTTITYSNLSTPTVSSVNSDVSLWAVKLGVKYRF
ncbi:MAG: TonB-dependent receptor [Parvibaculales bacterium]